MAQAVESAIENLEHLLVEAGTGTGKTFAYLLPVLMAGKKTIVSTGTRNLQDQLFHRDLPTVTAAFGQPVDLALLKGRSNYLCLYRLEQAGMQGDFRHTGTALRTIRDWSAVTRTGDKAELVEVSESAPIWPAVTSTPDNCLGQECPLFNDCFVVKARRKAQAADVVIVNHHLLLADMRLKEDGFGDLLPGAEVLVLDEAHQFPETAGRFFGVQISGRQITGLMRDTVAEAFAASIDRESIEQQVERVKSAAAQVRHNLGYQPGRINLQELPAAAVSALADLTTCLHDLEQCLQHFDGHTSGLDNCRRRAREMAATLAKVCNDEDDNGVAWVETTRTGFQLQRAPLDVSRQLHAIIYRQPATWVFTSATLAVGDNFAHFAARVGLEEPPQLKVESTFNYKDNSLLYIPKNIPNPGDDKHTESVVHESLQLLDKLTGGAFLLFTSYRALHIARNIMNATEHGRTLLVQGDQPRDELLRIFRADGAAILLGTSSFWEGVDVRGAALELVVIDKLPFASPGDPLLQARLEVLRKQGGNPFVDYQLPHAVLSLKQGVGRLIRDVDDVGICMICDPRLFTKGYGRRFLESLPPLPIERTHEKVLEFIHSRMTNREATS
ncbi:MAG: ATP-dependent DNA helicase [Gammaproteobacteria bacterium]|nr:ATP-dependent DNA helicase [Gammaproteobacteria bacterium]